MDFLTYAKSLNPSVLSLPIMGHLNTYDQYNRAVTISGSPRITNPTNQGFGFISNGGGRYAIADGAEQDFTDQTIFVYFPDGYSSNGSGQYLVSKRDGVGFAWVFQTVSDYLYIYNGASANKNTSGTGITAVGKKSVALTTTGSSASSFYQDGVLLLSTTGLDLTSQPNADIYVGARYTGTVTCENSIGIVAIFSSALTNEQIELLHYYATKIRYGYHPKTRLYVPRKDDKGAVIDLWGPPNANNVIADRSGNGNDGVLSDSISFINSGDSKYLSSAGDGDGAITISSDSTIDDTSQTTYQLAIPSIRSLGETSSGRLIEKDLRLYLYMIAPNNMQLYQFFSGTDGAWNISVPLNSKMFLQITYNKSSVSNDPTFYINGIEVSETESLTPTGTYDSDVGKHLYLFNRAAKNRQGDLDLEHFRLFPSVLSSDDLRDEYVKFATGHVIRHTPRFEHPVTLAAVTSPNQVGPWMNWNRTHEWLDNGTERYIKSQVTSNTYASLECTYLYGARYTKYNLDTAGKAAVINSYSIKPDLAYNAVGQTGYMIYHNTDESISIYRQNSGTISLLNTSGASWLPNDGSNIEVFQTIRVTDGQITVWTRESNHTTWTQACQATDTTYTSSNYCQGYTTLAGCSLEHYGLISWPYGDSLLPNDISEIAD